MDMNPEDTLKILVATDIHLGFAEKEPERANDSFTTFEEILCFAKEKDVDFILLGGDLFHENKPSRYALHKCIHLLKKHTFGNKPIDFEVVNERDPAAAPFLPDTMNYEDANLNVSYPVFSIHGNHDDPTGRGCLCSLDLLSEMGLVNHFGKCLNLDEVEIKPLLFRKGKTKLALYGLGAIRDLRLNRLFQQGKVTMIRPAEDLQEWFNVFVVHQNRAKHPSAGYLPEEYLEDFIDLVIWGHEHECRIVPEQSGVKRFSISQPGSSVATSLSKGEEVKKHVGILNINKRESWIEEIPLKTVRPFCIEDISIENCNLDLNCDDPSIKVMEYCSKYVERMIVKSKEQISGDKRQPKIPLIRLRVEFTNADETFSIVRFGQKFLNKVANAKDIIIFHRKRQANENKDQIKPEDMIKATENELVRFSAVELVRRHFESASENQRLEILTENGLGKAVQDYVDKKEYEAISEMIKHQKNKTAKYLISRMVTENTIDNEMARFKEEKQKTAEEDAELDEVLAAAKKIRIGKGEADSGEEMDTNQGDVDDDQLEDGEDDATAKRGGGRGRGRARGQSRGRGRGRGVTLNDADDSIASTSHSSSKERGSRGRGRASSTGSSRGGKQQQPTISSMMQSQRTTTKKQIQYFDIEDSDDDDVIAVSSSKRRKTGGSGNLSTKSTQGIDYYDDDDDVKPNFSSSRR